MSVSTKGMCQCLIDQWLVYVEKGMLGMLAGLSCSRHNKFQSLSRWADDEA